MIVGRQLLDFVDPIGGVEEAIRGGAFARRARPGRTGTFRAGRSGGNFGGSACFAGHCRTDQERKWHVFSFPVC
jgi:hypothetical protein